MQTIEVDGVVLAKHIKQDDWQEGLSFFSSDSEFIQVGAWRYDNGKKLLAHVHNEVDRKITRTNEVLFVVSGSIRATIYSLDCKEVCQLVVSAGDTLVLLESGHGYTVLEDGTRVLEVKNGPYLGADIDRKRIGGDT